MAKISEITLEDIKNVMRIDFNDDDSYIKNVLMPSAKQYIKSDTGLADEDIETKEDLTTAYIVLIVDMYGNKEYMVKDNKVNVVVDSILNRYCINLL